MVEPVSGGKDIPEGYGRFTLRDDKTNKKTSYLVPVGRKIHTGNKTYVIQAGKEVVIPGHNGQAYYDMIGVTLQHFDTNKDGRIDSKDSSYTVGDKIHKDRNKPKGYDLMDNGVDYDAYLEKGEGYANYTKDNENFFEVRIEDAKK